MIDYYLLLLYKMALFRKDNPMEILGNKHNTDKVTHHKYHEIYDFFLNSHYKEKGAILEIGTKEGASLNMWKELFPNAFIYGMDIGKESKGERYQIFRGDQSNLNHLDQLTKKLKTDNLFFINDDGSHIPEHQLLTFNVLFPLLSEGGIYIIEDIETSYWTKNGLYGYKTKYGYKHPKSIIEIFKDVVDTINSEFSRKTECNVKHLDYIANITFSKNCIIIAKKKQIKQKYRFLKNL